MALSLGQKLSIRTMVYVAGQSIPYFWPMRSFIHHNPLHGLENLPFEEAAGKTKALFHARAYLPRSQYQEYLQQGKVSLASLQLELQKISSKYAAIEGIDLNQWLSNLLMQHRKPLGINPDSLPSAWVYAALQGNVHSVEAATRLSKIKRLLNERLPMVMPVYEVIDYLYGDGIGDELDELVIKSCLDFFDEGQSVWGMPGREQGFFKAWSKMAARNPWLSRRARFIRQIMGQEDSPEAVIARVLQRFEVPENHWMAYLTRELSQLHGWVGFIRWRQSANHYYWSQKYPADLIQYLAVRLTLSAALLMEHSPSKRLQTIPALQQAIDERGFELYLRYEFFSGRVLPKWASRIEKVIAAGDQLKIAETCQAYWVAKQQYQAQFVADELQNLASLSGSQARLLELQPEQLDQLLRATAELEQREGIIWLRGLEAQAMQELVASINLSDSSPRDKRPFTQALFCIDTRSERIRRQLESVGDYQTFGIAGFFGVPFSFMELGKGSETHLCPVLITPKNLVLEVTREETSVSVDAIGAFEKVLHELKESILTPFVTVEAIGLLFGFDMVGKTLAPRGYHHWRRHLTHHKPATSLLIDKLSRDQADSIIRAVQRAVIMHAIEHELNVPLESVNDDLVRDLREIALGHLKDSDKARHQLALEPQAWDSFLGHLRNFYRINAAFSRHQMQRLGRIGFTLEEQVGFVATSLRSIGLIRQFSRFVLIVGHGSSSENNPYESALDCGACGGDHGLVNARVLAQMANKPKVRERLRRQGLLIDDDVWFMPVMHNTTTDELTLHDLELLPSSHLVYLERLRSGLRTAKRLCAQERLQTLSSVTPVPDPAKAFLDIQRNALDWSQVRPEWGLSGNLYFIIGKRDLTRNSNLAGRSFLHSYDYLADPKRRLLENILAGPLVVGQWINMEHYFSTVDNERFGSGSKVYHNVAGRFGVMSGNQSDLRTGLPSQTVLLNGKPYHEPIRLITVIQAPFEHAVRAVEAVASVRRLVRNHWVRLMIIDPLTQKIYRFELGDWAVQAEPPAELEPDPLEARAS